MMSLHHIAKATNATVLGLADDVDVSVSSLCRDSREDCTAQLFAAIPGENFDGHDYVKVAKEAGAVAALVERPVDVDIPQLKVDSVMQAMADCTTAWRQAFQVPMVAITGSAGKTTLKEMLGGILLLEYGQGVITEGNFNNEIGVPLTVTRLNEDDKFAVIEMGMNHPGEISRLSLMAQPDYALINNASAAHLEGVGTVADVATAKGEIIDGLSEDGILFVNADDDFAQKWLDSRAGKKNVTFGLKDTAEVRCSYQIENAKVLMNVSAYEQTYSLSLPVLGEHNVRNALAAIAVATQLGVSQASIIEGLETFEPPKNRSGKTKLAEGISIFDDTYNANLASMRAAIELLAIESTLNSNASTVVVLGDIGELGAQASDIHKQVGEYAKQQNITSLLAVGDYADDYESGYGKDAQVFADKQALIETLRNMVVQHKAQNSNLVVLVKGSRYTRMEEVVRAITDLDELNLEQSNEASH